MAGGHKDRFRELHHEGTPLVLPNAWDAASAVALAGAGFRALATTSGGVAESLGWKDFEQLPADDMFAAVARICAAVDVPVTADIEAGYGLPPAEVAARLRDAGAVGCNLEETDHAAGGRSLVAAEVQAERLAAVRAADADLVINARVDVFLPRMGIPRDEQVAEAVRRGRLYLEAGADCVYPIGAGDDGDIAALVREMGGPVNVLVRPGVPPLARLAELGVARVTFGSGLFHRAIEAAVAAAAEWADPPTGR